MIGGINYASSQIASVYSKGEQRLADTLTRIASGKKFQSAAEDMVGFLRAKGLQADIDGYDEVTKNLTEFKSYTAAAVDTGSSVYESLVEMKDIATKYAATTDTDLKAEYVSEFNALKTEVASMLDNSYVDGVKVTTTGSDLVTVNLDPDAKGTLELNFTSNANSATIAAFDIAAATDPTTAADVQTEIDNALSYLSQAKAYDGIAERQINLTATIVASKEAVMSMITDIDEAEETNNALDQSIRQQAAMSMMSQANLSRQAILKLYE